MALRQLVDPVSASSAMDRAEGNSWQSSASSAFRTEPNFKSVSGSCAGDQRF